MQKNLSYVLFFSLLIMMFSCKREDTEVGLELQSPSDGLDLKKEIFKNTDIKAYTVWEDSLNTFGYGSVFGYYKDDVLGEMQANVYTQITLTKNNLDLSNLTLDSITLDLQFSKLYPSKKIYTYPKKVFLQVYQLSKELEIEAYYSTQSVPCAPTPLYEGEVTLSMDSIGSKPPHISVKLSEAFLNSLKTNFTSNEAFISATKGLCLKIDPARSEQNGTMMYLNLSDSSSLTGLKLHYRDGDSTGVQPFSIGRNSLKFSEYKHNYAGTVLAPLMSNRGDSVAANPNVYVQNLGGTSVQLNFPTLEEWGKKHPKAVINSASLILPLVSGDVNDNPPHQLYCFAYNQDRRLGDLIDLSENYFDGKYESRKYRMRITRHIQAILNGGYGNWGLVVRCRRPDKVSEANHCVIDANNISLEILYSE